MYGVRRETHPMRISLVEDLGHLTRTHGAATLADSEAEVLVQGDVGDELNGDGEVVARHDHLAALGEGDGAGHVSGTEVELGTIVVVERGVTATFFLLEDIDSGFEFVVGFHRAGLGDDHTTADFVLVDTAEQQTHVVASFTFVEDFAEHFDAGDGALQFLGTHTDDVDGIAGVDNASLDTAGGHSAATGDREDVLDGHQEVFIFLTDGLGNPLVDSVHQLVDSGHTHTIGILAVQSGQSGTTDDGDIVAIEIIGAQKLADFHLDEVEQLGIVNKVALVEEDNQLGNTNLTGEQDVLTGLGHGTVGGGHNEDSTVHLGSTSNHVLHIVSVTRAVNVSIVTSLGLILNVSGVDGDTTLLLFGSGVDGVKALHLGKALLSENLGDSSGEGGLTMVNVADSTDVDVRFRAIEFFFCHF